MNDSCRRPESITREIARRTRHDIAPLLDEYAELTSFYEAAMLLQTVTGQIHLVTVYDEDLPDLRDALKAEIAVEQIARTTREIGRTEGDRNGA